MKRTKSQYIILKNSSIHNRGVFAKVDIPKNVRIIEYVGEKITKAESDRRADLPLSLHQKSEKHGAVYIFHLNKRYDLDGFVKYNTARYINHSCNPNCEAIIRRGHIYVVSERKIKKGEEITYNYGYDYKDYQDHKCRCMSPNCIGYIWDTKYWNKVKKEKSNLI